jgi:hypothetical protein
VAGKRAEALLEMMLFIEMFTLNRAWQDLSDEELLWDPMPDAWLFWHIASMPGRTAELDFLGGSRTAESGWTSPYLAQHPTFATADAAVTTMRTGWRALDAALRSATDEQLEQPRRFWGYGGPGPMGTGSQIVASTLNEISHHGTQIGVLRDLYRLRGGVTIERLAE